MTLDLAALGLDDVSWIARACVVLVVACLALLAWAKQLEDAPMLSSIIGALAGIATIACGAQAHALAATATGPDGAPVAGASAAALFASSQHAAFALVVTGAAVVIAMLLLHTAELFDGRQRPEAAALVMVGAIGAIVLATGGSMLQLAVGVELLSLSGATLVALGQGARPLEAGFKYFLLTAVTFAAFLFGMSLVFLGTGSLDLPGASGAVGASGAAAAAAQAAQAAQAAVTGPNAALVLAGAALMVIGLGFKLALAPVHFGALDAYTAGPPALVGFVMLASKIGAAAALARLAFSMGGSVQLLVVGLGLFTIGFGVVASFAQTDLRRLLAYSAVAHAGFLAVAAGSPVGGADAARFYVVGYGAAAALAFAALAGTGTDGYPIARLGSSTAGLGRWRSLALLLALASLAGVPPLPGFWVKLAVLLAAYKSWGVLPAALAALGGVVGIVYYLRPMPDLLARWSDPGPARDGDADRSRAALFAVLALAVVVVAIGLAPFVAWTFVAK